MLDSNQTLEQVWFVYLKNGIIWQVMAVDAGYSQEHTFACDTTEKSTSY